MAGDPRSKLDIIYQEVLGEVADLVGRVEAVTSQVAEVIKAESRAAQAIHEASAAASEKLRGDLDRACNTTVQKLRTVAREVDAAAGVVGGAAKRFALLALLVGLGGGVIGGTLAGIALSRVFFGG